METPCEQWFFFPKRQICFHVPFNLFVIISLVRQKLQEQQREIVECLLKLQTQSPLITELPTNLVILFNKNVKVDMLL